MEIYSTNDGLHYINTTNNNSHIFSTNCSNCDLQDFVMGNHGNSSYIHAKCFPIICSIELINGIPVSASEFNLTNGKVVNICLF